MKVVTIVLRSVVAIGVVLGLYHLLVWALSKEPVVTFALDNSVWIAVLFAFVWLVGAQLFGSGFIVSMAVAAAESVLAHSRLDDAFRAIYSEIEWRGVLETNGAVSPLPFDISSEVSNLMIDLGALAIVGIIIVGISAYWESLPE